MKKIFLLLFLGSLISSGQELKMGIIANPQLAWMNSANNENIQTESVLLGLDIGLSIEKYFTKNYAVLTGLSLNNTGGRISYTDSIFMNVNNEFSLFDAYEEMAFNIQYVKIPLALKFKTNQIGYFTYFAQLGMEGNVKIKSLLTTNEFDKADATDEIKLFNAGYFIGGGAEYSLGGSTSIVIGFQYQNGIVDVTNTTDDSVITPRVSLLFGIMF